MWNNITFVVILLICTLTASAQQDSLETTHSPAAYFNSFHMATQLEFEDYNSNSSFSMIHGIRLYQEHAVGIGLGLDLYDAWYTFPFFLTLSTDFAKNKSRSFFLETNGGYAKAWQRSKELEGQVTLESNGGWMFSSGMGLRLNNQKYSTYIQLGYRLQQIEYSSTTSDIITIWGWYPPEFSVDQRINRIFIQLGLGLR